MPEYKENEIAGSQWNRFERVVIENPRNGVPVVACTEQQVITLADNEITRTIGGMAFNFNPAEEFALLDPETNLPTGETATGAQVRQLIFSYVLHEAMKRDEMQAARTPVVIPPSP